MSDITRQLLKHSGSQESLYTLVYENEWGTIGIAFVNASFFPLGGLAK